MASTKLDIDLELKGYQNIKSNLESIRDRSAEISKVNGTNNAIFKQTESAIAAIDKIVAIMQTKIDKNGKMSIDSARDLQEELSKLLFSFNQIQTIEKKGISGIDFSKAIDEFKKLKDEAQASIDDIEKSLKKLDSKQAKYKNTSFADLYAKNSKGSRSVGKSLNENLLNDAFGKLNGLSNESIRKMISNAYGNSGNFNATNAARRGLSLEQVKQLYALIQEIDNKNKSIEKTIKDQNIELDKSKKNLEEIKNNELKYRQSVNIATPGTNEILGNAVPNIQDTLNGISTQREAAERSGSKTISLAGELEAQSTSLAKATRAFIGYRAILRAVRKIWQEAIRTIKDMDESLTGMTVVTGKSREEVQKYIPTLRSLANQTSSTMTEVANLTTEYLRQGRSMQDALTLTEQTAQAAKISGLSTADTITYMTAAINGFNLAADQAERVSDIFANVAAKSATSYEQLAVAISKVSAQANLAGMDIEYTTALLAKGIETTQEAPESVGTALKTVIARMRELKDYGSTLEDGANVNNVENALKSAGIALRDEMGSFRDLNEIFNELGPKWDTLNTMQRQAIAQAVAGTRQQSRFVAIMQDWNRTLELVTEAQDSAGAAAYQYSQYAKGMEGTMERLTTGWQGFVQAVTDSELIIGTIDKLGNALNGITDALEKGGPVIKNMFTTFVALASMGAASVGIEKLKLSYYNKQLQLQQQLSSVAGVSQIVAKNSLTAIRQQNLLLVDKNETLLKTLQTETFELVQQQGITKEAKNQLLIKMSELGIEEENREILANNLLAEQMKTGTIITGNTQLAIGLLFNKKISEEQVKQLSLNSSNIITQALVWLYYKKQYDIKKKEYLAAKKDLTTKKQGLLLEMKKTKELQDQAKANITSSLKKAGGALGAAALMAAIGLIIKGIVDISNTFNKAKDSIEDFSNKLYEINTQSKNLQDIIEEYEKLNNTVNRTAEQEEKLISLQKQLQDDYKLSGTGNDLLSNAKIQKSVYDMQSKTMMDKAMASTLQAYATVFGDKVSEQNFFKNSTFENAFKQKYKINIQSNLANEMEQAVRDGIIQAEQYQLAKDTGLNILNNVDVNNIAHNATKNTSATAENIWGSIGIGALTTAGGAGAGILTAGGIGAAIGTAAGPVGTIIGAVVGGLIGVVGGIVIGIQRGSKSAAEEAQIAANKQMNEITVGITDFSKKYAETYNKTLAEKYNVLSSSINQYDPEIRDAIKETYKGMFSAFGNQTTASNISKLEEVLNGEGKSGTKIAENLINRYGSLGDKGFAEIFNRMGGTLSKGGSSNDAFVSAYEMLADKNNSYYNEAKQIYESNLDEQIQVLEDTLGSSKRKLKNSAKAAGVSYTEYVESLNDQIAELQKQKLNFDENVVDDLKSSTLSSISGYSSLSDIKDTFTGIQSGVKNIKDMVSALNDGNLTMEQLVNYSSQFVSNSEDMKEIYNSFLKGDYANMQELLFGSINDTYTNYINSIDDFIRKQEAIKNDTTLTDEARDAAKIQIQLAEMTKSYFVKYNEFSLKAFVQEKELIQLEQQRNEGNLKAYDTLIELQKEKVDNDRNTIITLTKGYTKERELLDQIYKGTISWSKAWKEVSTWSETEQATFKQLSENTADYYKDWIDHEKELSDLQESRLKQEVSLQNSATDIIKNKYKEEQEALKNSLNKRKQLYQDYFKSLENEDKDEDYASKRSKLESAIARLTSSTDSQSLQLRKEYEKELQDLNKEYNSDIRSRQLEAINTTIDDALENANTYYEEIMNNTRKLFDEYMSLTQEKQNEMFKSFKDGFTTATSEAQQQMWKEYATMMNNLKSEDKNWIPLDPNKVPHYASGGFAKHTGLAWVDGTPSKPEAVLTSEQTNILSSLVNSLSTILTAPNWNPTLGNGDNSGVTIEALNISVNGAVGDATQTGYDIANAFMDGLRRTGINLNKKA